MTSNKLPGYKKNILFVDDNLMSITLYKDFLKEAEFNAIFCTSSEKASEVIRTTEIHGIVTDLIMPSISGLELIALANEHQKKCFKILITGSTDINSIIYSVNVLGVTKILLKPIDLTDQSLKQMIYDCLGDN